MNFNDGVIVFVKGNDYKIHFQYMGKDDAINIIKNSDFKKMDDYNFFPLHITMSETTCYKINRETILNREKVDFSSYY